MRIQVLIPNSGMDRDTLDTRESMLSRAVSPGVEVSVDCIPSGPESIESNTDEVLAGPLVLQAARKAEQEGFDAFVVYCFSDLAVQALRESAAIPIIGPGETALAAADILSNRFTVLTTTEKNISRTYRRLMHFPAAQRKLASVRALNIPAAQLREDPDATRSRLEQACRQAAERDGADTAILGCLGMAQYGEEIETRCGVKIIDPAFLALAWAELSVRLGLRPGPRSVARRKEGDL